MVLQRLRVLLAHRHHGDDPYDPITLRFVNADAEDGYLRQNADAVYASTGYFIASVCAYVVVQGLLICATRDLRSQSPANAVARMQLIMYGCICALQALHGICMKFLPMRSTPRLQEATTVASIVAVMIMSVMSTRYYLTKVLGHPFSSWPVVDGQAPFSDTRVLLAIDACITVSHLFLPIRWCVLAWLQVSCVLSYSLPAIVLGTPESGSLFSNIGALTMLVVLASIGKRFSERAERLAFVGIAKERTLRAEAQFQLDQHRPPDRHRKDPSLQLAKPSDTASAGPSTTPTDAVLCLDGVAINDLAAHLQEISEIGIREHWLMDFADVKLESTTIFGEGSFGVVVAGTFQGAPVAIKKPKDIIESRLDVRHLVSLTNELRVLRRLRHPNIVAFYGACIVPSQDRQQGFRPSGDSIFFMALILERVQGASMQRFVQDTVDPLPRCAVLLGISRALRYLHGFKPAVVHGDLKPSNVLIECLESGPHAKLLDFGLSRVLTSRPQPLGGTYGWLAPEVLKKGRPNTATDAYSFGCLVYYAATKLKPRAGMSNKEITRSLQVGDLPELIFPPGNTFAYSVRELVHRCTAPEPHSRPLMRAVCEELERLADRIGRLPASSCRQTRADVAVRASRPVTSRPTRAISAAGVNCSRHSLSVMHSERKAGEGDAAPGPNLDIALPDDATRWEAQLLSVWDVVRRWRLPLVPSSCCPFHCALLVLERHCRELATWPCDHQFAPIGSLQCTDCFMCARHVDKWVCDLCGGAQIEKFHEVVAGHGKRKTGGATPWTIEL